MLQLSGEYKQCFYVYLTLDCYKVTLMTNFFSWLPDFPFSFFQGSLALLSAFIIGLSKAGIKGIGVIAIPLMAIGFGMKSSTGLVLLILIAGDLFAITYYFRYVEWHYVKRLLPYVLLGVLLGVWIGDIVPEQTFKQILGWIILISVIFLFYWEFRKIKRVPTSGWFGAMMGLIVGFTTMVGNLAGPFADIYFLAMQLPKNRFIGTVAWLFFITNLFKLPFHIFVWGTINAEMALLNLWLLPGIVLGILIGVQLIKIIQEHQYRRLTLLLTAIGALFILIR